MTIKDVLWVEKYRPHTLSDCILPTATAAVAAGIAKSKRLPNLLLTGPAGTGKTTLAFALASDLGYDTMMINGSNEGRLIDTLRTKITDFASSVSFTGARKVVIVDEADYVPDMVQAALRNFIEEFANNCSFVLTCNFPNRLMDAIHSRTTTIDFSIPQTDRPDIAKQMLVRAIHILDNEGVEFDKKVVAALIKKHFPDFRRTINELQRYANTGKIDTGVLTQSETQIDKLIECLKDKNWRDMRTFVATTPNLDMVSLCRKLYDKSYEFCKPESIPQMVLILAEYQRDMSFVADKEIHTVAMLTKIMLELEFVA